MKGFLAAMRFLTVLPLPGTWGTEADALAASVPFFPIVGLVLGGLAAAAAWGLSLVAPPLIVGAILVVLLLAFSGGLHMDGLSDTADGFLSSRLRERILEIMKDSHAGAMGIIAVVCVLLVKFAAIASLASLKPANLWPALLLTPLAGRCAMVVQMGMLPYVRPGGLGTIFCQKRPWASAVWSVAVLAAAGALLLGVAGLAAAGVSLLVAMTLAGWSFRKIGGATGDTFGAACEIVELAPPLTVALWPVVARGWL